MVTENTGSVSDTATVPKIYLTGALANDDHLRWIVRLSNGEWYLVPAEYEGWAKRQRLEGREIRKVDIEFLLLPHEASAIWDVLTHPRTRKS
jgi:hypothetical protein